MLVVMSRHWPVVVVSAVLSFSSVLAQEGRESVVTQVVTLENIEVDSAVELVGELYGGELYAITDVEGTNRMVLRGEQEVVQSVVNLIADLDAEDPPQGGVERKTEYVPVSTYPAKDLVPLVMALDMGDYRVAVDQMNRQLVITGTEREVAAVKAMVKELDQPRRSLVLHFFFLSGEIGAGAEFDPEHAEVPEPLLDIAFTLAENGFYEPRVMGMTSVRVNSAQQFEALWGQEEDTDDGDGYLDFELSGEARTQRGSDTVDLEIKARMRGHGGAEKRRALSAQFELGTTLSVTLDEYVILAAAPSTTEAGSAIALAVRVTRG
jgi:hypothetical protein